MRPWIGTVAVMCALAGCSGNGSERAAGTTATECRVTSGEPAQGSATSAAEAPSIKLGPSSQITAAEAAREAPARGGTPLILSGTVYLADCRTPAAGAEIHVWQTDARGVYGPGHGTDNLRCCYLQGTLETDSEGRYMFETIKPGRYHGDPNPPPDHIHMELLYGEGGLLTEIVFADEVDEGISLREEFGPDGKRLVGRFDIVLPADSV
jgi:protocatechuate 3,4-dioxygenase beta subunit